MNYNKTTWATGDKITAEKLNHLEGGVEAASTAELPASTAEDAGKVLTVGSTGAAEWAAASGGVCVVAIEANADQTAYTLLSDYDELKNAIDNRLPVFVRMTSEGDSSAFSCVSPYMMASNGTGESFQITLLLSVAMANGAHLLLVHYAFGIAIDGTVQAQVDTYPLNTQTNP